MSTPSAPGPPPRWTGVALLVASVGFLVVEAVVAAGWDVRPYSYADDYVNFLGSRFVGEFEGYTISSPRWLLMDVGWIGSGVLVAAAATRLATALRGWRRALVVVLGAVVALGLVVFAVVPLGPATLAAGLLPLYLAGAFGSIGAGNALGGHRRPAAPAARPAARRRARRRRARACSASSASRSRTAGSPSASRSGSRCTRSWPGRPLTGVAVLLARRPAKGLVRA